MIYTIKGRIYTTKWDGARHVVRDQAGKVIGGFDGTPESQRRKVVEAIVDAVVPKERTEEETRCVDDLVGKNTRLLMDATLKALEDGYVAKPLVDGYTPGAV